ncbi:MAG: hypothetical protein JWR32_3300 [Mycobacterium sp.]|nr:hypothetical protein [Mycobacterium sp.]
MRGETKGRMAMSLLPSPFADQSHHVVLGRGERCPAAGWPFAFAVPALGVGDGFLSGQRRALGPGRIEVFVAQGITSRSHRGFVAGVQDLEPDRAHAFPYGVCCAEHAGSFEGTAVVVLLSSPTTRSIERIRSG